MKTRGNKVGAGFPFPLIIFFPTMDMHNATKEIRYSMFVDPKT